MSQVAARRRSRERYLERTEEQKENDRKKALANYYKRKERILNMKKRGGTTAR